MWSDDGHVPTRWGKKNVIVTGSSVARLNWASDEKLGRYGELWIFIPFLLFLTVDPNECHRRWKLERNSKLDNKKYIRSAIE